MIDLVTNSINRIKPHYTWIEMLKLRFKDKDKFLDIPNSLLSYFLIERFIPNMSYPEKITPDTTWLDNNFYVGQILKFELLDKKTIQILDFKTNKYIATAHLVLNKQGKLDLCMWYNAIRVIEVGLYPNHKYADKLFIEQSYLFFREDTSHVYISGFVEKGVEGAVFKKIDI